MKKVILYARVSTEDQKRSGLGLEAQLEDMQQFCKLHNLEIVEVCEEYVSGKYDLDRRPVLKKAFDTAGRIKNCYILTSKLDRLSRKEAFIHNLLDQGKKFMCVETGINCSPLEISMRSMIAQEERRKIAERVKAALAAKKARGEPLGTNIPNVRRAIPKAVQKSKEAVQTEADAFAEFMRPNIERMRKSGMSVNAIAADLNKYGTKTHRGRTWHAKTVCNLMERLNIS